MKLQPIINTELSEYTIKILAKQRITTIACFIRTPIEKLMKILNLSEDKVFKIITSIEQLYGPSKQNLKQRVQEWRKLGAIYKTGIIPLDNILGCESLKSGVIWEFCGVPGVGKTQLAFSVLINFIMNTNFQGLYIDTKMDFSSMRIKQMLKEKGFASMDEWFKVMEHIKVETCLTIKKLMRVLYDLEAALKAHQPCVTKIKLIIIDSIPAIMYQLKIKTKHWLRRRYIALLDRLLHRLAQKYYVIIIIINISLHYQNTSYFKSNEKSDVCSASVIIQRRKFSCIRPSLGFYWNLMPRVRLSLDYPLNKTHNNRSLRIIKIIKSSYMDNTVRSCKVHLTEQGVV